MEAATILLMGMDIYSIAGMGMEAAARKVEVSANNVANAATEGYEAKRFETEAAPDGGVTGKVVPTGEGTDIAKEFIEQIVASTTYKANAQVVRTAEDITGALLNLKA